MALGIVDDSDNLVKVMGVEQVLQIANDVFQNHILSAKF